MYETSLPETFNSGAPWPAHFTGQSHVASFELSMSDPLPGQLGSTPWSEWRRSTRDDLAHSAPMTKRPFRWSPVSTGPMTSLRCGTIPSGRAHRIRHPSLSQQESCRGRSSGEEDSALPPIAIRSSPPRSGWTTTGAPGKSTPLTALRSQATSNRGNISWLSGCFVRSWGRA